MAPLDGAKRQWPDHQFKPLVKLTCLCVRAVEYMFEVVIGRVAQLTLEPGL